MAFKKFLIKNLEAAEKHGTEDQQIDMEGVAAVLSRHAGELSDFMGGRRKLKDHAHHAPKDLADAVIEGVETVVKVRKEIGG